MPSLCKIYYSLNSNAKTHEGTKAQNGQAVVSPVFWKTTFEEPSRLSTSQSRTTSMDTGALFPFTWPVWSTDTGALSPLLWTNLEWKTLISLSLSFLIRKSETIKFVTSLSCRVCNYVGKSKLRWHDKVACWFKWKRKWNHFQCQVNTAVAVVLTNMVVLLPMGKKKCRKIQRTNY